MFELLSIYLNALEGKNDEESFIEVYNTYKRLVYYTAQKIVDDPYLAEDVLQEVFLYVAKNFRKIHRDDRHKLAAFLVSCTRSRAIDLLRKQKECCLEETEETTLKDGAPVPEDAAVSMDSVARLTELISQMKPIYRDTLRLLALGYSYADIAEALGVTQEVVRLRISRGRNILWKELQKHEQ